MCNPGQSGIRRPIIRLTSGAMTDAVSKEAVSTRIAQVRDELKLLADYL
jgi:hypothetical protein